MPDNVQLPGTGQSVAAKSDAAGNEHQEVLLANTAFQDVNPATSDKQDEINLNLNTTEENIGVADLLIKAMDKSEKMPLQVQLPIDLKQEADGGLLIADMKGPYIWQSSTASQQLIIDCTGYQSILVHKITTGVVTPSVSNDGKTWSATLAIAAATSIPAATILTAAGMYTLPVISKYLQLVGPASVIQCFIYLSRAPCFPELNATFNIAQIAGTPPPTANVAGTLVVGGAVQTAVAPTTFPLLVAGVDGNTAPLTRRMLTDVLGRLQIGNIPSQRSTGINMLGVDPSIRNILEVQDTSMAEGMEMDEVLVQVLFELRILNQQMYELPRLLRDGLQNVDQPEDFRDDMGIFNQ